MALCGTSKIGRADFLGGETEGEDERSSFPEVRAAGVPFAEGEVASRREPRPQPGKN